MTTVDAIVLGIRTAAGRLAEVFRQMTGPERILSAVLGLCIIVAVARACMVATLAAWSMAGTGVALAWLVASVIADALVSRDSTHRVNVALMRTNAAKPTGAPRVAEVSCKHGDMHRFVYGPDGWASAGPAPDTRPEPEGARV
jgi:hypothetical protein